MGHMLSVCVNVALINYTNTEYLTIKVCMLKED